MCTFVGLYRQCPNCVGVRAGRRKLGGDGRTGNGSAFFSFRMRAFSAVWPDAVVATYSIKSKLQKS